MHRRNIFRYRTFLSPDCECNEISTT